MTVAYLTVAEYRAHPTATDTNNLVPGALQPAQDAALASKILEASAWLDTGLSLPSLVAGSRTELHRARVQRDGTLSIHPKAAPLNQLTAVAIGTHAANLVALTDLTGVWIDEQQWIIPNLASGPSGSPWQFGGRPTRQLLARIVYVSGWPQAALTADVTAGANQLPVDSTIGWAPTAGSTVGDEVVRIIDGEHTETVTVTGVTGSAATLAAGCVYAHSAGAVLSALPADVKAAAVLATTAMIRARSSEALIVGQTVTPGAVSGDDPARTAMLSQARRMLASYGRVR